MNPVVEAVELQFIKLTKQIQIEKEMYNNLNFQLTIIRESCTHIKDINEVKNSFKTSISIGVKHAEENILSSHTSLDVISGLENELKKIMEQQNNEKKRKKLMENLWNYERQWEVVKDMYKNIPTAKDVLELQKLTKQMAMEIKVKEQSIMETRKCISSYKKMKGKRKKVQIINLINASSKNKLTSKEKFDRKEKLRILSLNNNKVKTEKLALIGNQHNVSPPNFVYRKTKIVDGFTVPPSYGILKQNFKATDTHGITPFSLGPSFPVPELMIPSFNATICRNAGQATSTVQSAISNGGNGIDEQISGKVTGGICIATPRKRKIDPTLTSGPRTNNHVSSDKVIETSKKGIISTDQRSSASLTSKLGVSITNDGGNLPSELMKERSQNVNGTSSSLRSLKYLTQTMQQMTPRQESEIATPYHEEQRASFSSQCQKDRVPEETFNFGPRGAQTLHENETISSIPKALYNFDNKSKQTNVWDIFN